MADTSAPHVTRVRLYRNGDPNFIGKLIVVNPRYYRNFESFLDTATWTTQSTSAVTRICTPKGRHNIDSVDKLANGGNYVAVGRAERFKKLKYGEAKFKNVTTRLPPIWRSHLPSSGRFRKVYEGEKQALKRIYVYRNGDNKTPARMILLKKRTLTDMELVLAALQESNLNFDFAISKLFTLNGKQIYTCDEIVHDGKYVALERGSRFKPINYEGVGYISPRNAVTYTIPTARSNQSKVSYSPRKIPHPPLTQKPALAKPKKAKQTEIKREEKIVVNYSLPQQESILSSFDDDKRESFSHVSLSVTPPTLDESPDFTLSENIGQGKETSKEAVEKDAFPQVAIPNDLDELPEQQKESIGLKLYNASGMQREWGDMVVENKDTLTEKLLDDVPAEEIVDEDITESVEDKEENVTITETIIDTVKDKLVDESPEEETVNEAVMESIEDVTESTEDVTESTEDVTKSTEDARDDTKGQEENETKGRETSVEEVIELDDNKDDDEKNNESNEKEMKKEKEKSDKEEEEDKENITSLEEPVEKAALQIDGQRSKSEEPEQESRDEESEDEDDKDKEDGAESPQQSRRSSQDMNSEDEVRSEDEQEENDDDDKDDTDDKDDEKSDEENDQSANDATDDATDDKNDESNDDNPSNTEPSSEKEDSAEEADEPATKENKTNKKVEEQRADPEVAKKKEIKQNNEKVKRKQKRIDNKA